jgi:2'-5' RNA ligase
MPDPLIVTLLLDDDAQERFDRLRAAHFPALRGPAGTGRFRLDAHVTLFHALPGEELAEVRDALAEAAVRHPFGVAVTGVGMLGRGVALNLESAELTALRAALAVRFRPWLTRQDRQWSRPHVTVQNKVEPAAARALHAELAAAFRPETVTGRGLGLWHYRGGPWEPEAEFPFRADPDVDAVGSLGAAGNGNTATAPVR